jgi:copper chaperone CopZ
VRSALSKVPGVESVDVGPIDQATKSAAVKVKVKGKTSDQALLEAFKGTQYSAKLG